MSFVTAKFQKQIQSVKVKFTYWQESNVRKEPLLHEYCYEYFMVDTA